MRPFYSEASLKEDDLLMPSPAHSKQLFCALAKGMAAFAILLFVVPVCPAQTKPEAKQAPVTTTKSDESAEAMHLLAAIGKLNEKFQSQMKLPAPRTESRLLSLLPPSTIGFAAFANYGDVARQATEFLDQELKDNEELKSWWNKGEMATMGPQIRTGLQRFYELNQFLGDEFVVSASLETKDPNFLAVSEVHKPGLKKFLSDLVEQYGGEKKVGVHVMETQDLSTKLTVLKKDQLLVLVRPDFVVAASDLATLRVFNERLDQKNAGLLSTPFGKRAAKEYQGGLTFLAAADLETVLRKNPPQPKDAESLKKSGFGDTKYLIWEHKELGSKTVSQSELSFTGPRHGSAAWLAKPGPLASLDFASPDAIIAGAFKLTSPAQIFKEVQDMFPPGPSSPFASLPQAEKALGLSVNDDLIDLLGGELGFELDSITPPTPAWRVMLSVKDVAHLQKTLATLVALGQIKSEQSQENGVTYYSLHTPAGAQPYEIDYAFLDGYLVAGSTHAAVTEAAKLHHSGTSLAKSAKFRSALPPGRSAEASLLFYDDPTFVSQLQMMRFGLQPADGFGQKRSEGPGSIFSFYGEESAISEASSSGSMDVAGALIVAAIAIPNLVKSKMAVNEASAVGALRTITTAQITYASTYPQKGFSPNLARLGPDPNGGITRPSALHAELVDASIGGVSCTGEAWCTKSGYQFRLTAMCDQGNCTHFVAVAKPESESTGTRNFCVTDDGVIHYNASGPLTARVTIAECKKWQLLQ
jgi:type IV pilus assembly protein PilA